MKYTCDICGATFVCEIDCQKHETDCKGRYEKVLFMQELINDLLNVAKFNSINFGVNATFVDEGYKPVTEFCAITGAEFDIKKNRLTLQFKRKEKEKKDDKNEKSK